MDTTTTTTTEGETMTISNGYEIRDAIKAAGGKYSAGMWTLTAAQYETLIERVDAAGRRSNKRDRQLWTSFRGVRCSWDEGETFLPRREHVAGCTGVNCVCDW